MFKRIIHFLSPPIFADDEEKTRTANILNMIAISSFFTALLYGFMAPAERLPYIGLAIGVILTAWLTNRRGYVRTAAITMVTGISAVFVISVFTGGGVRSPAYGGFFVAILLAGLFLGWKAAISVTIFSILYGMILLQADARGLLPEPLQYSSQAYLIINSVLFTMTAAIFIMSLRILNAALRQASRVLAERKRIEIDLLKRESILEVTSRSAELLLKAPDWRTEINTVLERLGQTINASHAYLFENHTGLTGKLSHPFNMNGRRRSAQAIWITLFSMMLSSMSMGSRAGTRRSAIDAPISGTNASSRRLKRISSPHVT